MEIKANGLNSVTDSSVALELRLANEKRCVFAAYIKCFFFGRLMKKLLVIFSLVFFTFSTDSICQETSDNAEDGIITVAGKVVVRGIKPNIDNDERTKFREEDFLNPNEPASDTALLLTDFNGEYRKILDDYHVFIGEKIDVTPELDALIIQSWGGGSGVWPIYSLIFLNKQKQWSIYSVGQADESIEGETYPVLVKDKDQLKVTAPFRKNHQIIYKTFIFDQNGKKINEVNRVDPKTKLPEKISFSELEKRPPVAVLHYLPIKNQLSKKPYFKKIYETLEEAWPLGLQKPNEGALWSIGYGSHAENWSAHIVLVSKEGAYFIVFPVDDAHSNIKYEIYTNANDYPEVIKDLSEDKELDIGWFNATDELNSFCRINGKKVRISKLLGKADKNLLK